MSFYLRPSLITLYSPNYNSGTPLILSDHNRSPVSVAFERIETRERMANGNMRSYYITDKRTFELSWENLPSRSTGPSGIGMGGSTRYTADGYSGANTLADFYEAIRTSFDMTFYVDDQGITQYTDMPTTAAGTYTVYFSAFSFDVQKRGQYFDLVNVSMSLEEA